LFLSLDVHSFVREDANAMHAILNSWVLSFICLSMIVAAIIDGWKLKVPNWLTFPLILSGLLLGLLHDSGVLGTATGEGGFWAALAGTGLGCLLLLPVYAIGGMGGGDVKMQMGFGAWVGAYYGLASTETRPGALGIIFGAFCLAAIVGAILAVVMMLVRGQLRQNLANASEILGDIFGGAKGVQDVADRAQARKPRMHLLPYGIPLCIGFITYLASL
jgi:prepilin peptidase CpaA